MPTLQDLVKIEKFGDRHYRASSVRNPLKIGDGPTPQAAVGFLCAGHVDVLGDILGAGEIKVIDRTVERVEPEFSEPPETDGGDDDGE